MINMKIGLKKKLNISFEEAIQKVNDELTKQGFGVITTIDVKEVIKKKLNKDFRKFLILGACNPEFAHKAIEYNDEVGLLMPCNVVIQEKDNNVEVMIFNPQIIDMLFDDNEVKNLTSILYKRVENLIANL